MITIINTIIIIPGLNWLVVPFCREINKSKAAIETQRWCAVVHVTTRRTTRQQSQTSRRCLYTYHLMMMAVWDICFLKKGTEGSL